MQGEASSEPLSASALILQPEPPTSGVPHSLPTGECSPLKLGTRTLPTPMIAKKKHQIAKKKTAIWRNGGMARRTVHTSSLYGV